MTSLNVALKADLEQRKAQSLYRYRKITQGPQGPFIQVDNKKLLGFCSNDYLGLANHPTVRTAFIQGANQYGVGSGAAHLVTGHTQAHHDLEEALAKFVNRPRALLFSTGYMANIGVINALLGRQDLVIEDRLNHASLIDGGRFSGAEFKRYLHGDDSALKKILESRIYQRKLVVTDGVFSMDGDIAPLAALSTVVEQHDAWLMVDDAHGLGVLGDQGRGTLEYLKLNEAQVPILIGTLGKALGTFGAFVAGEEALIETLIQQARTYIYTTAPPSAVATATLASLQLTQSESWRRERLIFLIQHFRKGATQLGLKLMDSMTPIQPLLVGSSEKALQISQSLLKQGIFITPIRPPTVPQGTARLRITLTANHTEEQVNQLLDSLARII
ncbi:8-amino-7-oxononanoate synthase [Candidatus Nitrosacidococcus tergens]|uniref:8-amino-7-oxononanoate synthase n=1 Tax=Candidatus Nitrosacidococcus tergens TaxID=553981 RepID=A0A7G1QB81_9GAMM|nr:8-amino-7-oxononanoate synthase [Candidatus Nitrosacidococcus tergens]CAB1276993.1 8-amino-7-oxononanoate synthase [Candidatus Nitrosacidococcus tergens]